MYSLFLLKFWFKRWCKLTTHRQHVEMGHSWHRNTHIKKRHVFNKNSLLWRSEYYLKASMSKINDPLSKKKKERKKNLAQNRETKNKPISISRNCPAAVLLTRNSTSQTAWLQKLQLSTSLRNQGLYSIQGFGEVRRASAACVGRGERKTSLWAVTVISDSIKHTEWVWRETWTQEL